jgi:hypothetical protein
MPAIEELVREASVLPADELRKIIRQREAEVEILDAILRTTVRRERRREQESATGWTALDGRNPVVTEPQRRPIMAKKPSNPEGTVAGKSSGVKAMKEASTNAANTISEALEEARNNVANIGYENETGKKPVPSGDLHEDRCKKLKYK